MIRQFFYVSRSLAAPGDLDRILASARRHNEQHGVTGALLFTGGHFAQLLEGASDDVAQTVALIEADPRHDGMTCLVDGSAASRRCAGWAMALMEAPGADVLIQELLAQSGPLTVERGQRLLRLMFDGVPGKGG